MGEKLSKTDKDFYKKINAMRKVKSGGKYFADVEKARDAQRKSIESRRRNKLAQDEG